MKFSEMKKEELEVVMSGKGIVVGNKGGGRKEEVLNVLKGGIYSVKEIGGMFNISSRNVSSVICYLRDDGYEIRKMNKGKEIGLVLWSVIRNGEKVGNRVVVGKKGKVVGFDFEKGCFKNLVK